MDALLVREAGHHSYDGGVAVLKLATIPQLPLRRLLTLQHVCHPVVHRQQRVHLRTNRRRGGGGAGRGRCQKRTQPDTRGAPGTLSEAKKRETKP
eukprot:7833209-Pyramimonas_sp.AAC.1